jgi:hydroxymethylglutaryl-CoA lyase
MSDNIQLIECPRDAWQGLRGQIPTATKVEYLKALIAAGFKHIDAVSFVSPRAVPQMADSEDVLKQLDPPDDVEIIGIVVNTKGADRAIATEAVSTLGFPYSLSETFLQKNQGQTAEENYETLEAIVNISMAFGNPYGDSWSIDEVVAALDNISDLGVRSISLADTVGVATPEEVSTLVGEALNGFERYDIGVHLHSRRDLAEAKILAAYDAGCRRFDSAIGGLGGCPFAQDDLVGNIPTEIVVEALRKRNAAPTLKSFDKLIARSADFNARFR